MILKKEFLKSSMPVLICYKRFSWGLFYDICGQTEEGVDFFFFFFFFLNFKNKGINFDEEFYGKSESEKKN